MFFTSIFFYLALITTTERATGKLYDMIPEAGFS